MALVENTLFGVEDKVANSIEALRTFEPQEGYYVAFSGGKDSVVIKKLCDMAGVKYDAHYHVTSVDPPELVQFIKESYPDVQREIPHYSDGTPITMWNLIPKMKAPPTRVARYCCAKLKEVGGYGRFVVTGVRWAESVRRRASLGLLDVEESGKRTRFLNNDNDDARKYVESCFSYKKTILNPIINWTDEDVWEFIHQHNVPYCKLYDEGFKRVGCIGCPMAYRAADELNRYPKYKANYIRAFDRMMRERERAGYTSDKWTDGQSVMKWWLSDRAKTDSPIEGQMEIDLEDL